MSLRRVGGIAVIAAATFIMISCGQVYRPVVIPINITPPNSQNFHAVFAINTNIQANPGTAMQIDVSGDSDIGQENMGISPTHMAILPNDSRVFVASAGSLFAGESDVVTAFAPAAHSTIATGLGPPTVFTYPNTSAGPSSAITAISETGSTVTVTLSPPGLTGASVGALVAIASVSVGGFNGTFPIFQVLSPTSIEYQNPTSNLGSLTASSGGSIGMASLPVTCSYLPDYVTTTQNTAVFVSNYGVENATNCNLASTDSVAMLSPTTNAITNIQYLPGGAHPIAMAETPDALNLYVLNQGNNTVTDLSPVDLSTLATITVPGSSSPLWAVARSDSHRVYVLTQGGTILPIDPSTNTILPSATNLSAQPGANFMLYDPTLNRLYVTNPGTLNPSDAAVYIFATTGGTDLSGNANDTPVLLSVIPMNPGSALCPNGCSPSSLAALPNGERFYVASYENEAACSDANVGTSVPCIVPMLTVFDALSMTAKTSTSTLLSPATSLSLLTSPLFSATQYAVPPVATCVPPATYTPGTTRFRMFTVPSADSSHVYVSVCDAGVVADVATNTTTIATGTNTPDTLMTDLAAPFGNCITGCTSVATITSLSITSNVVTFQALNNFIPGTRVSISNLTSAPGAPLNGQILTVLATGLTGTTFECNVSAANVGATPDTGTAVPQSSPQSPTFMITGQ